MPIVCYFNSKAMRSDFDREAIAVIVLRFDIAVSRVANLANTAKPAIVS